VSRVAPTSSLCIGGCRTPRYKQFCDDTTTEKTRSIAEAEETIGVLKADIQKFSANAARLTKEIAGLDEDISIWNGDIKAATSLGGFLMIYIYIYVY
jgi:peptidoglycan hydrolase CwlO-like protein